MRIMRGASLPALDKKVEEMVAPAHGVHVGPLDSRPARLFVVLASFLAVNAMIAEFVGVKIFALEPSQSSR